MRSGWATRRSLTFAPKRVDGGQAGRKVRGGVAWVRGNSEQVGAGSGGPALQLAREEEVGQLRLKVGEPPRVPILLPAVEANPCRAVEEGGHGHHARRVSAPEERQ